MTRPTLALGDDGTPAADVAWLWINNHTWTGWRLEILTAQLPPIGRVLAPGQSTPHPWDPPRPREVFEVAQFDEVVNLVADADPRLALSRAVDLLVIGPHGPGFLKSLHIGSTADWLLMHPPAPMAIVRHGHVTRTAVLCTDGSTHAARAAEALCRLPWVDRLAVTVLAVTDGRTDAHEATATAAEQLRAAGAEVSIEVQKGKPTKVILEHLDQTTPDLVVLGTKGLTGVPRLRLGSTASSVARAAKSSVLVACADDAETD